MPSNQAIEFTVTVPSNATYLLIYMGGSGDVDIYAKRQDIPWPGDPVTNTESEFGFSVNGGLEEYVVFFSPTAGTWNIAVYGIQESSGIIIATAE